MMPRWMHHLFTTSAIIGICGWFFLIFLFSWWFLQPVSLPTVKEPMPVLNVNDEVAIGETLYVKLTINKPVELSPINSSRFLACTSGNLVTLTSAPIKLPVGSYDIISEDVIVPAKIAPGDECVYEIHITYQINPIRREIVQFQSEPFAVLEGERKGGQL